MDADFDAATLKVDEVDAITDLRKAIADGASNEWILGFVRGYPFAVRSANSTVPLSSDGCHVFIEGTGVVALAYEGEALPHADLAAPPLPKLRQNTAINRAVNEDAAAFERESGCAFVRKEHSGYPWGWEYIDRAVQEKFRGFARTRDKDMEPKK